eukprot:GHVS01043863.1.p1 GENE.GHVS01043863.1~~GHVS01043863.1.p1  ORF type:complete len:470 (-),score=61.96 GHVS01043863.1:209-1618(-)
MPAKLQKLWNEGTENNTNFRSKGVYCKTDEEYYKAFFRDRDRKLDGKREEVKRLLEKHSEELAPANNKRKRISAKEYWYKGDYESPCVEDIWNMNSDGLKRTMMNEARLLNKGSKLDVLLWVALMKRASELVATVHVRTILRFLQAIASVQIQPTHQHFNTIVQAVYKRNHDMRPHHKIYIFQAFARLRWRDERLLRDMKEMAFAWAMLQPNFLIKGCNSICKLDLASHIVCKPLRRGLGNRIPFFTGRNCQAIKAITVLELFSDDMITAYLMQCFSNQMYFRTYNRHLVVIELYLRLLKPQVYDELADHIKVFFEECRKASQQQQPTSMTDCSEDTDAEESDDTNIGMNFLSDVSYCLRRLGVKQHYNNMRAGPYLLDIYYPRANLVLELNSSYQFYAGTQHLTATCKWRHRLLTSMGFRLIHLSEFIWNSLETTEQKVDFLRKSLPPIMFASITNTTTPLRGEHITS